MTQCAAVVIQFYRHSCPAIRIIGVEFNIVHTKTDVLSYDSLTSEASHAVSPLAARHRVARGYSQRIQLRHQMTPRLYQVGKTTISTMIRNIRQRPGRR